MFVRSCGPGEMEALLASETSILEYLDCRDCSLRDLDFSGRHLRWVRLSNSEIVNCSFRNATLEGVFADLASFGSCSFDDALIFESVFAGSRISDTTFVGSTADQCNFNGIEAERTDFSDASLRHSRFLGARLTAVSFINCDLKNTLYQFSERNEVSFKHSNHEEACF
jgi:uncharacterized protein YjbI with pentapeptide repeats